jgi:CCR4-NOT transcriptional regulation complex NOT5 subunit
LAGAVLVALGLISATTYTIFEANLTFSDYGSVIIDTQNDVTVTQRGAFRAGSAIVAAGTDSSNPVVMATSKPIATDGLSRGDWYFRVDISAVGSPTTPANQVYKVEVLRWNPSTNDYNTIATLYIAADGSPAVTEGVRVYAKLTPAPTAQETFMVLVSRYP